MLKSGAGPASRPCLPPSSTIRRRSPPSSPLLSLTPASVPSCANSRSSAADSLLCTDTGRSYANNGRSTRARMRRKCRAISSGCVRV